VAAVALVKDTLELKVKVLARTDSDSSGLRRARRVRWEQRGSPRAEVHGSWASTAWSGRSVECTGGIQRRGEASSRRSVPEFALKIGSQVVGLCGAEVAVVAVLVPWLVGDRPAGVAVVVADHEARGIRLTRSGLDRSSWETIRSGIVLEAEDWRYRCVQRVTESAGWSGSRRSFAR